ncbi:MFS transporter [Gluconacetobacter tumulisoli]|uniref:MFS transporter n=1 Tax=Gluconacetobacter tumulisoli TaxID=1286189 RepID=UPI003083F1F8
MICALLFLATTINYLDRQVLGLLKPLLEKEFGWTEKDYGYLVVIFQASYAGGIIFAGRAIDRLGTKLGYALCMALWSVASAAHAMVGSTLGFGAVRVLLGVGESGNFPAALKAVSEWFPKRERALAVGILTAGTSTGAIAAPAVVPWLAVTYGWRPAFLITALTGLVWLLAWQVLYRSPADYGLDARGRLFMSQDDSDDVREETISWIGLLAVRRTWILLIGKFLTDPVWWFMLFWLPSYFVDRFGLNFKRLGLPLMIVYLATSVGSVSGGYLSSLLVSRGWRVQAARQATMLAMALLVLPLAFVAGSSSIWVMVAALSLAAAAHQGWSANLLTTATDNFPRQMVGSVTGIGGMAGSLGGLLFPLLVGVLLDHYKARGMVEAGYHLLFVLCGGAYLVAWLVMQLMGAGRPSQRGTDARHGSEPPLPKDLRQWRTE